MNGIKISIIIPVYNAEIYLTKCIESVINQNYTNLEVILLNDGSTDGSAFICEKFQQLDDRIKYLSHTNIGVSQTRNIGLNIASGDYVVFVDSDDWVDPDFIESYITSANETCADLFYQGLVWEYPNNSIPKHLPNKFFKNKLDGILFLEKERCFGAACNKMFKREIIDKFQIRFDPTLSLAEDKIFTLEYFKYIKSILLIDKVSYHYRRDVENSLTQRCHTLNNQLKVAELQRCLQQEINKDGDEKFQHFIEAESITINKIILVALYRYGSNNDKRSKLDQMNKLKNMIAKKNYDVSFDRDTPKFLNTIIKYRLSKIMNLVMYVRYQLSFILN